ncbi:hypothetical protein [Shouchella miscanthi]|uniref:hypothetical protein n=1 Tax=Shouchella miscanthi TaxID=2598861 RepID=UPI00119FC4D8|nr:hypothetical protein [Shouchella miscanthi]
MKIKIDKVRGRLVEAKSLYSLYKETDNDETLETVWIKVIKNIEDLQIKDDAKMRKIIDESFAYFKGSIGLHNVSL